MNPMLLTNSQLAKAQPLICAIFSLLGCLSLAAESPAAQVSSKVDAQTDSTKPTEVSKPDLQASKWVAAKTSNERVQLGITMSKPGSAVYAQLPGLPRGSGFIIQSVAVGGSADLAGLRPMDVIWKLDDQLLINDGQLMTLLSMHRPGDKVTVSYFHAGLEKTAEVKLQKGKSLKVRDENIAMYPPIPGIGLPAGIAENGNASAVGLPPHLMRVISYENRSASISDKNGTATLTSREGKPWLHVETAQGVESFNGPVEKAEEIARVPIAWRSRLPVLERSLKESVRLRRLPRVRHVPRPKHRVAAGE